MEEPQPVPTLGDDRWEKTGETLRALREQANRALDDHRRRLSTIETELNQHVQQISKELVCDRVVGEMEEEAVQQQQDELQRCQESLVLAETELEGFRDRLVKIVAEQETQHTAHSEEVNGLQEHLQESALERDRLASELQQVREVLAQDQAEIESLRSSQSSESEEIAHLQQQLDQAATERRQLDQELEEKRNSLSQAEVELATLREESSSASNELDSKIASKEEELAQLREQQVSDAQELDRLNKELEITHCELEELRNKASENLQADRDELTAVQQDASAARQQLETLQQQLGAEQEAHEETKQRLETVEESHEKAASLLNDAEQRILELGNDDETEEQFRQTQRKFELALADVQKLKRENAELHEELARSPETDQQESLELVSMRDERDTLAARLEELEISSSQQIDDNARQELDDLRQRFELAVEDVRQLKQENAELSERLKTASATSPANDSATGGDLDWQAQKARLMAELDAEDQGDVFPERQEERATIEGTISITDRVVAEKDREIAALQAQLEASPEEKSDTEKKHAALEALFDQDEAIQAERERLRQAQEEWKEKLREGELELSVQRAKIAREQLALEEKLASSQNEYPEDEPASEGKPRRRWLSALGLKDDED